MISVLYSIPKEEFLQKLNESVSIKDFFRKINFPDIGDNRDTFFKIIKEYGFDKELEELRKRTKIFLKNNLNKANKKFSDEETFCENSNIGRANLKEKIIKRKLIPYKCASCGIINEYNGKPISLQLHHINGVYNDNRLENLVFLCPNCHSQTENYSGKRKNILKKQKAEKKKELNNLIETRKKSLEKFNLFKYGWVSEVAREWKTSRTQVKRWIKKYYPNLEYLKFKPNPTCSISAEERIKFLNNLDKSQNNWVFKVAKEWNISLKATISWMKKHYPFYIEYINNKNLIDEKKQN